MSVPPTGAGPRPVPPRQTDGPETSPRRPGPMADATGHPPLDGGPWPADRASGPAMSGPAVRAPALGATAGQGLLMDATPDEAEKALEARITANPRCIYQDHEAHPDRPIQLSPTIAAHLGRTWRAALNRTGS